MRAVKISFAALMVTALVQVVVIWATGSVALLADTIHNFSDALTAVPLLFIAFPVEPRARDAALHLRLPAGRGPGRGVRDRHDHPVGSDRRLGGHRPVDRPEADHQRRLAVRGRAGRVRRQRGGRSLPDPGGRRIGSAALEADGYHARTDGFTSLAVSLGGAAGPGWGSSGPTRSSGWPSRSPSSPCCARARRARCSTA